MTYGRLVCEIKEHKSETHQTQLTVNGNLLDFPGMLSTPTATVTTVKSPFNSVISTPGAKCLIADVKHFYLNNDLPDPEYMKLHLHIIPQEIIDKYALHDLVDKDGWVYLKIVKIMYCLKQAGIIANMELTKHLDKFGYYLVQHTPGLWRHKTRATIFTLVVNNFAIKYATHQDANHILQALRAKYTISTDWEASLYIGITLKWDYTAGYVDLSMPKYVAKALHKFKKYLQKFHPNNKPDPRHQQLCNQIRDTSRRQPYPTSPSRQLHHFHGLGSITVHRHHAKMGIHRQVCRPIHAKICRQSTTQV